jgi:hypothetical protein
MKNLSAMNQPMVYQISVRGRLADDWSTYFEGMRISHATRTDGAAITILTGTLADQAALQGTLQSLYALGLPLIALEVLPDYETE